MIYQNTFNHLVELKTVISRISDLQYIQPLDVLDHATLGSHVRHILEFYEALITSLGSGTLNYDHRKRSSELESSRHLSIRQIDKIMLAFKDQSEDKPLVLTADYSRNQGSAPLKVNTTFHRELIYNIEHLVHHLAIIKIGCRSIVPPVPVSDDCGVAASTLRNRKLCAQ